MKSAIVLATLLFASLAMATDYVPVPLTSVILRITPVGADHLKLQRCLDGKCAGLGRYDGIFRISELRAFVARVNEGDRLVPRHFSRMANVSLYGGLACAAVLVSVAKFHYPPVGLYTISGLVDGAFVGPLAYILLKKYFGRRAEGQAWAIQNAVAGDVKVSEDEFKNLINFLDDGLARVAEGLPPKHISLWRRGWNWAKDGRNSAKATAPYKLNL